MHFQVDYIRVTICQIKVQDLKLPQALADTKQE